MVHAFIATGLLVQQFLTLCRLARIGVIGRRYIYQGTSDMYMYVAVLFRTYDR